MKKNDFSIREYYENNNSKKLIKEDKGFFGELFHGFIRALASIFNINLDQMSATTFTSARDSYGDTMTDVFRENPELADQIKAETDEDGKVNTDDLDPEKAPDEESRKAREELRDKTIAKQIPGMIEGAAKEIEEIKDLPAFFSGIDDNKAKQDEGADDAFEKSKPKIEAAVNGLGKLLGTCQYIKSKVKDFDFKELEKPSPTPGDLVQQAAYYVNLIQPYAKENTQELDSIASFCQTYAQQNNINLKPTDSKHKPSDDLKGPQGEAIKDAMSKNSELTPEEIEEKSPEKSIKDVAKQADLALPKAAVDKSLQGWFDSLSPTSQKALKTKKRIEDLRNDIATAIDASSDDIAREIETAIKMWREENEERLIKGKRFSKKNFDSLQDLVPKLAASVVKKVNESSSRITRKSINEFVSIFLDLKFKSNILLEQESTDNPDVDSDPTKAIKNAAQERKGGIKSKVGSVFDNWEKTLSQSSKSELQSVQRGKLLKDLIFDAIDGTEEIVRKEVERAIKNWRSRHEDALITSKQFAKKNFDSLENLIPDLVVSIMKRKDESSVSLTKNYIQKYVNVVLNKKFYSSIL